MKLLHSASRQLSAALVAALKAAIPSLEVIRRDLDANPIPHLDGKRLLAVRPANAPEGAVGIADDGGSDVLDEYCRSRRAAVLRSALSARIYAITWTSRPAAYSTPRQCL